LWGLGEVAPSFEGVVCRGQFTGRGSGLLCHLWVGVWVVGSGVCVSSGGGMLWRWCVIFGGRGGSREFGGGVSRA